MNPTVTVPPTIAGAGGRRDRSVIVLAMVIFSTLSLWAAIKSDGFLEGDSCTHYMYARFALRQPVYLVDIWARPLCTGLYAIPAALGKTLGVRMMSLLLALGCSAVACRLAANQGYRRPVLALIFTLAQPLVFLLSFSELTELPFALLIALAFWAYQKRQWLVMTILVGFSPLARPEGFGFLGLAGAALLAHRRWRWLAVLPIPLLLWNWAGWKLSGDSSPWWLLNNWPWSGQSSYETGSLLHFVALMPAVASPLIFPALPIGIWRCWTEGDWQSHRGRCQRLIAIIPLLILVGHSLLYWLGKMASNGELRYMVVVAPFWALLSARGWEWAFVRFGWHRPLAWAAVAALLPLSVNWMYKTVPLHFSQESRTILNVADWYANRSGSLHQQYPRIMGSDPVLYYGLDFAPGDSQRSQQWDQSTVSLAPPGTFLVWDSINGPRNSDRRRIVTVRMILDAGWVWDEPMEQRLFPLQPIGDTPQERIDSLLASQPVPPATVVWHVFRSPRTASGAATASESIGPGSHWKMVGSGR